MDEIELTRPVGLDWFRLRLLYREAFPASERKPFTKIQSMYRQGLADVWCIRRKRKLLGFAATVNGDGLVLLDYFAVAKQYRGKGVGSAAMMLLQSQYAQVGFFVEIESTREEAENHTQRLRRKAFYEKAGLLPMDTEADVFGVRMELLGSCCRLTLADYRRFYQEYYSPWAAQHINPV